MSAGGSIARITQRPPSPDGLHGMTDIMVVCDRCGIEWGWGATAEKAEQFAADHNHAVHAEEVANAEQ